MTGSLLKSDLTSMRWFPSCEIGARNASLLNNVYEDFDQQSEQLVGHDQSYLQLTPGAFQGRFLSAFLGDDVAIHMEYCNQALEQEVGGSPGHLSFGVILSDGGAFFVNGRPLTKNDVFILPPSGNLHVTSPLNGAVMAITIRRDMFLRQSGLSPMVLDWLDDLTDSVGFLRAGRLPDRLREDAVSALEGIAQTDAQVSETVLGQALAAGIASKLSLEWSSAAVRDGLCGTPAYDRFQRCKSGFQTEAASIENVSRVTTMGRASKRSVEQAFSTHVSMGPLAYLRIMRLHDVKRKLADQAFADRSIGDIAAEHGFWDWSHFSHQYRRHFGELPSFTRQSQVTDR